jgi:hypothetical protein
MADQPSPHITLAELPADILSCITRHMQQDAWHRDQKLDDVATLRSVCRSLRRAVDVSVTHANVDAAELRSTAQRYTRAEPCIKLSIALPTACKFSFQYSCPLRIRLAGTL